METGAEHVEVAVYKVTDGVGCIGCTPGYLGCQFHQTAGSLLGHGRAAVSCAQPLMAELRKVGIVGESLLAEPPVADTDGDERSEETSDVYEHVEDLETHVAFLGVFLIVVELSDHCLEVAFEQTVTECDDKEAETCQGQDDGHVGDWSLGRPCNDEIAHGHQDKTCQDSSFVVPGPVGDDASYECQQIDGRIEDGVDQTCLSLVVLLRPNFDEMKRVRMAIMM